MELSPLDLARGARRWWWLLLLGPLLLAAVGYGVAARQAPRYEARVLLLVGPPAGAAAADYNALLFAERLTQTYQRLVTIRPVLAATVAALGLPEGVDGLRARVTAQAVGESQLLVVRVTDGDPERAAVIANALAAGFASYVARPPAAAGGAAFPAALVAIAEPAVPPDAPYAPRPALNLLVGIVAGLVLAGGAVAALVYGDGAVKTGADVAALEVGPLLASIAANPVPGSGRRDLFVLDRPTGEAAEAIRLLRANVERAAATEEIATLAVCGVDRRGGKDAVAANLAVTLAQAGFTVALVDADLHDPRLHATFEAPNDQGLSAFLTAPDLTWRQVAVETEAPNLVLVPSGSLPPNPADLLSRERFGSLLGELKRRFGVVVVATPPLLSSSDAVVVAGQVDGVVLVCQAGRTRREALRRAAAALEQAQVRLVGIAMTEGGRRRWGGRRRGAAGPTPSPRGTPATLPAARAAAAERPPAAPPAVAPRPDPADAPAGSGGEAAPSRPVLVALPTARPPGEASAGRAVRGEPRTAPD